MKNYILILALLITGCGNQRAKQVATTQSIGTENPNSSAERGTDENNIEVLQDSTNNIAGGESLNDIRFANWTEKNWYDNDYFHALRKYINAWHKGQIENADLIPYKSVLKSKFAIMNAEPYIMGGMFVSVIFVDAPNKIFEASIYSDVDEKSGTVSNYRVKTLRASQDEIEMTKEEILTLIKDHPENKLW